MLYFGKSCMHFDKIKIKRIPVRSSATLEAKSLIAHMPTATKMAFVDLGRDLSLSGILVQLLPMATQLTLTSQGSIS